MGTLSKFSLVVFFVFLLLPLSFGAAPYSPTSSWHRLQQVMSNESNTTGVSLDLNLNSIVDRADTVGSLDGDASLGDGTTNAVLKIKGATTLWSAIDLYSGSSSAIWGIGRNQNNNQFYIDRSGVGRIVTIDPSTLNVGIGTSTPNAGLEISRSISTTSTGLFINRGIGVATGASTTLKGIQVIQQGSNDATSVIGVDSYASAGVGQGLVVGVKGAINNVIYSNVGPGIGVYGVATHANVNGPGTVIGVKGQADAQGSGSNGYTYAGYFDNTATVGSHNYGVYVTTASQSATGLTVAGSARTGIDATGVSPDGQGPIIGVKGTASGIVYSNVAPGIGVLGYATMANMNGPGTAIGVKGQVDGQGAGSLGTTIAGYFENNAWGNSQFGIYQVGGSNYFGGAINGPSDVRLKKNIAPIPHALKDISALNGVSFNWRNSTMDTKTHLGVIAQNVRGIYPELVNTNKDGFYTVEYTGLIPPMIEAIKELNEKQILQEQQIETQQQKINELEGRISLLTQQS